MIVYFVSSCGDETCFSFFVSFDGALPSFVFRRGVTACCFERFATLVSAFTTGPLLELYDTMIWMTILSGSLSSSSFLLRLESFLSWRRHDFFWWILLCSSLFLHLFVILITCHYAKIHLLMFKRKRNKTRPQSNRDCPRQQEDWKLQKFSDSLYHLRTYIWQKPAKWRVVWSFFEAQKRFSIVERGAHLVTTLTSFG